MINVKNLSVTFCNNNESVLKNINFQINEPSIVLIAGKSGSGKSTLARTLIGSLQAFEDAKISGEIFIGETDLKNIRKDKFSGIIGYLPQYPADFVLNLLVKDELAFPLENLGRPNKEIIKESSHILDLLEITRLENKLMTELSSGELQKVSLATSLISNPKILILDEPFSRIDTKSKLNLIEVLNKLKSDGKLLLIFEHNLDDLLEICDQVLILDHGEIVFTGDPKNSISNLNEIDIPEISNITIPNKEKQMISYSEAVRELKDFLIKN